MGRLMDEWYPNALALGMTREGYWDGEAMEVCARREADRLRVDRVNREAWLGGAYVYRALLSAAPVLNAMSKSRRARDYPEPIELGGAPRVADDPNAERRRRGAEYMRELMKARNARLREGEDGVAGRA